MPGFDREALKHLPRRSTEVWQGGLVRIPTWVSEGGKRPFMPWGGAWVSIGPRVIHIGGMVQESERSPGQALDAFAEFALDPETGGYLPGRVEVIGPGVAQALESALGPLGIAVDEREDLDVLDATLRDMGARLNDERHIPGALSPSGATLERLAAFAEAARLFHEAAPWHHLTSEDLIRIEAPHGPIEHSHALVMGARGEDKGLLLFESAGFHERLLLEEAHDAVVFGKITELPVDDAVVFKDHGLPVAGPGAYPWAVRFRSKSRIERLDPRALEHTGTLLRALAATSEEEMDQGRWTRIVPAPGGPVTVLLALPGLLDEPARAGSVADLRLESRRAMERAQDLCYQAFDARGRRRVVLARQALAISPDCADAWSILADYSGDPAASMRHYREALAAAERTLGADRLAAGESFWADVGTRPFMRALEGLAEVCAARGLIAEAIGHYQRLLRLNPDDNQGARDPLAGLLLRTGDHAALETLLDAYDGDQEAVLLYARALRVFREQGDAAESREALLRAHDANGHVAEILLGLAPAGPLPVSHAPGSIEEARHAVSSIGEAWEQTAGALDWLAKCAGQPESTPEATTEDVEWQPIEPQATAGQPIAPQALTRRALTRRRPQRARRSFQAP